MIYEIPTFLKWAGGKQQLLPQFARYFPDKIEKHVEPFLGGGATFFYILKYKNPACARGYDNNADLINVYTQVKLNLNGLINELKDLEKEHNQSKDPKSYYYLRRTEFNTIKMKKLRKAALFIYLNKTCFNGLYRVNSLGDFNVPFNGENKIKLFETDILEEANELLNKENVLLEQSDFRKIIFKRDEFIYFDPPYSPKPKMNGFTKYTNNGFNEEMQKELANIFYDLSKSGNKIILSNSFTTFTNQLYSDPGYNKYRIRARRLINCDGNGRDKITELLITANMSERHRFI